MNIEQAKKIANEFGLQYLGTNAINGVGVGYDNKKSLYLLVTIAYDARHNLMDKLYPNEYHGLPVKVKCIGKVVDLQFKSKSSLKDR